ncbi:molybdate ABC transporter substrate-binding protein [uncultured Microbulbifer sp.]|uniref:molybdate ABC transporter substrate-binding protein n=1 Tax=uncultured Microbulbifer sp. TaxID=348147 RepID=UPI0026392443|nr:molybdate ABC transporter substrate-binding protein [uncultured Microbulbifer sp.]
MLTTLSARGDETTIAVASNFTAPMQAMVNQFEAQSAHRVKVAFGSSGKFFAQINHGAPFDAFFSADAEKPARLIAQGLAEKTSLRTYAEGKLVLWSRRDGFVDDQGLVLKSGQFHKLALANPKLAPYGAAAIEVLQHLKLAQSTRSQWVQGENISQTYQFVASGNADLGLIALSQVMRDGKITEGSAWLVPDSFYGPIRQDAVILKRGRENPALLAFWLFVKSPAAQATIRRYGYNTGASSGPLKATEGGDTDAE